MTWAQRLGHVQYWRAKGAVWIEVFRPWLLPIFGGAGLGKYLGFQTRWAVLFAVGIPCIVETLAIVVGWWEHRTGTTAEHYRIAAKTDPYKAETLVLLREIRDVLTRAEERKEGTTPFSPGNA